MTVQRRLSGRLVVVQVLTLALFATLLGRLWYVQVVGGDAYSAQARSNTTRLVTVQPQRGLVVDAAGRPLVTNRVSWVVTVDRSALAVTDVDEQVAVLRRLATLLDTSYQRVVDRTKLCGEDGAPKPPVCWNGSPYEPVPVAEDVPRDLALAIAERPEDFTAVGVEQRYVRDYPAPSGVNAAHLLGYVSPITADEYDASLDSDDPLTPSAAIGRAGVERSYDADLRGVPGTTGKAVDSRGRVVSEGDAVAPQAGDTLVTSIDATVQSLAETELRKAIMTARRTHDDVTGRNYEASAGAVVVMDPNDGRLIAAASYPSYEPDSWVGGISSRRLKSLYSERAGTPLLSRVTQAQLAPGSTFKPIVTAGALEQARYDTGTRLACSSGLQVGNRWFKNYESASYGSLTFDRALQLSCDTFFYRIAYANWVKQGGSDAGVKTPDPLVRMARDFGVGSRTGVDLPGETAGRIGDRTWRRDYWEANKAQYCKLARNPEKIDSAYMRLFAREFCADGYVYRAGDAVNFSIGQGETLLSPLQLAVAYGALSNGGTLYEPRIGKAVLDADGDVVRRIKPSKAGRVPVSKRHLRYIDRALKGTARVGTSSWKFAGFPLDDVPIRSKTGTAEVQGRQTTGWLATYDRNFVVVMMIEQGGTGSGSSGDAVRTIWEGLYGVKNGKVRPDKALIEGTEPSRALPKVDADGRVRRSP